jgi:hypothetical protein
MIPRPVQVAGAFRGILQAVLDAAWQRSKYRKPDDLIFTNAKEAPRSRLKPTIKKLGLPATVDFRSFRTMHSSLMSGVASGPRLTSDNMGHATVDVTQNVYNQTWEERAEAVSLAAASVWRRLRRVRQPLGQCKPFLCKRQLLGHCFVRATQQRTRKRSVPAYRCDACNLKSVPPPS